MEKENQSEDAKKALQLKEENKRLLNRIAFLEGELEKEKREVEIYEQHLEAKEKKEDLYSWIFVIGGFILVATVFFLFGEYARNNDKLHILTPIKIIVSIPFILFALYAMFSKK